MSNSGNYGSSLYGQDPYGSAPAPFGVAGATAFSPTLVQVQFTDLIDPTLPAFTDPGNYTLTPSTGPTPVIHGVYIESANSVALETDPLASVSYTVTVTSARSYSGQVMVPPLNTAVFNGFQGTVSYFSVGTSATRIRCVFSTMMLPNDALTDPTSYTVSDLNGNVLPVVAVTQEQVLNPFVAHHGPFGPVSVVLTLGASMQTTQWYETTLSPDIMALNGQQPTPASVDFQWVLPVQNVTIPISEFSGEVQGGIFGDPDGLVFFSPALNVPTASSVIQVENVSVCTTAYDQYTFPPQTPDPNPFFVWSPSGPQTTLGEQGIVLFGGFPSLGEVQFEFGFGPPVTQDQMPEAFDGSCCVNLTQTFYPAERISLLNNKTWSLFAANDVRYADIPANVAMEGTSQFLLPEQSAANIAGSSHLTATASVIGTEPSPPMFVCFYGRPPILFARAAGTSTVYARASVQHHAHATITASSTVTPQYKLPSGGTAWSATTSISAGAVVNAQAGRHQHASAPIAASSLSLVDSLLPPGETFEQETIIVLRFAMVGNSTMVVQEPSLVHWVAAHIVADSTLATVPEIAPLNIAGNSWMRVGRPHLTHGASVSIHGGSTFAIQQAHRLEAEAAITGYATVHARCEQSWEVSATMDGNASIFTRPSRNQHLTAAISGDATLMGFATKGPVGSAAILAGSAVTAAAVRNHTASVHISGSSAVVATPA